MLKFKRNKVSHGVALNRCKRNVIFHALMDLAMEERERWGHDTWRTKWLENLAEQVVGDA